MTLEIDILTLFPAMLDGPLAGSIPARIQEQGLAAVRVHDLRRAMPVGVGLHHRADLHAGRDGAADQAHVVKQGVAGDQQLGVVHRLTRPWVDVRSSVRTRDVYRQGAAGTSLRKRNLIERRLW